ncbi:MAG: hypothetical protein KF708_23395 [Pirellulales bacterium]|nr:hypothetical protein [Pirellulales bacterium]
MFQRIQIGWQLTKQSFQVLKTEKNLVIFPLLSGIACALVLASFAFPLWFSGAFESFAHHRGETPAEQLPPWAYVVMFAFYLANYFVIIFFNSALVACAVIRFDGGDPTPGDGLNVACARLPQIFGWALVAASVGMILRMIESRSEKVGMFVASLVGMAWSIITFFVVPVIVVEKAGPIAALRRSTAIVRKTWGESLTANVGVGTITGLLIIPAALLIGIGSALLGGHHLVLGGTLIAVGAAAVLVISLVASALNSIVLAALYMYGATGRVPGAFDESLLQDAFAQK